MSCTIDCLAEYHCGGTKGIVKPLEGALFAPWVEITFAGGNKITVGNESSPNSGNRAVIKSFQYGTSNGQGCEVEILDEEGGNLVKFMEKLNKTLKNSSTDYNMIVDFGWIIQNSNGSATVRKTSDYGGALHFLPTKLTSRYENGFIKFIIQGTDLFSRIAENRIIKTYGDDNNKITLKEAIRRILSENDPKVESVKYYRKGQGGVISEWKFKEEGGDGPKGVWQANSLNALDVIRKWINTVTTDDDKGIVVVWNCASESPEIMLWEAPPEIKPCLSNVGTFIVNGGNCSPVISFSPTAEWAVVVKKGNVSGGPSSAENIDVKEIKNSKEKWADADAGAQRTQQGGNIGYENQLAPDEASKKLAKAQLEHDRAATYYDAVPSAPITAELAIQGNPEFVHPTFLLDSFVSIIFINPFYITNGCDWLIEPTCNPVWSNKNWQILGVDHQIREGSYITTLKVRLFAPGSDIGSDKGLGGSGSDKGLTNNAQ